MQTPYKSKDGERLAADLLEAPEYDGKVIMIAWVHGKIPTLAKAFGPSAVPSKWNGSKVFDRVWILDFNSDHIEFSDRPQNLMPGDSVH